MMKPIAIIPARGGSKRIPKKNITTFCGKPMIAWTIQAAKESGCFADVIVSTDCETTASLSRELGASVPFLRTAHADDFSTVSEATLWTAQKYAEQGNQVHSVVQLMANTPLRGADTIRRFVSQLETIGEKGLISCFEPKFGSPNWAISVNSQHQTGRFVFPSDQNTRSQDLETILMPTGAIWGGKISSLEKHKSFYTPAFKVFEVSWLEALDIDTPEEFQICEILAESILRNK